MTAENIFKPQMSTHMRLSLFAVLLFAILTLKFTYVAKLDLVFSVFLLTFWSFKTLPSQIASKSCKSTKLKIHLNKFIIDEKIKIKTAKKKKIETHFNIFDSQ